MAFITGSHAYGTPTKDSDIDLVVRMPTLVGWHLEHLISLDDGNQALPPYPDKSLSLRFGKLNLICCFDDKTYANWLEGTSELTLKKPVTRAEAVATFKRIREENS